jgi:hypothetical protein
MAVTERINSEHDRARPSTSTTEHDRAFRPSLSTEPFERERVETRLLF